MYLGAECGCLAHRFLTELLIFCKLVGIQINLAALRSEVINVVNSLIYLGEVLFSLFNFLLGTCEVRFHLGFRLCVGSHAFFDCLDFVRNAFEFGLKNIRRKHVPAAIRSCMLAAVYNGIVIQPGWRQALNARG